MSGEKFRVGPSEPTFKKDNKTYDKTHFSEFYCFVFLNSKYFNISNKYISYLYCNTQQYNKK